MGSADIVKPGGGCLITMQDYRAEGCTGTQVKPYGVRERDGRKYVILQTWEFDGDIDNLSMYFVRDNRGTRAETHIYRSKYYAIPLARVMSLMQSAGFRNVRQIDGEFYQPILVGTKPE